MSQDLHHAGKNSYYSYIIRMSDYYNFPCYDFTYFINAKIKHYVSMIRLLSSAQHIPDKDILIHENHRDPGPCFCVFRTRPLQLSFVQCTEVCFKKAPVCSERRCLTYRTCSRKCDHVTPILKELHWLPVSERIKFKIMLLTFKALHQ